MTITIGYPKMDQLLRELTEATGEPAEEALVKAVQQRLERERRSKGAPSLRDSLKAIAQRCSALPVLDRRSPEEILGYDSFGLPR